MELQGVPRLIRVGKHRFQGDRGQFGQTDDLQHLVEQGLTQAAEHQHGLGQDLGGLSCLSLSPGQLLQGDMVPVGLYHPHPQAEHGEYLPQPGELRAGAVVHQYGSSVFHAATSLHLGQGLLDVGDQVGGVLDAAGEADQIGGDASGDQLLVVHLPVGGGGGVEGAGAGVSHVRLDGGQLEVLHKRLSRGPAALESEGHHAAGAVGHILLGQAVVLVPLQSGVGDKADFLVSRQVLGHRQGVLTVAGHPHVEALQPQVQQKGVLRGLDGAEIPHKLGGTFGDKGPAQTEFLGVGDESSNGGFNLRGLIEHFDIIQSYSAEQSAKYRAKFVHADGTAGEHIYRYVDSIT